MNKRVDSVLLARISSRMAKTFGRISDDELDNYMGLLMTLESNLLRIHRQDPSKNSRRAKEAIQYSLLTIDGYLRDIQYEFGINFSEEIEALHYGLMMSFDPLTSREIQLFLGERLDVTNKEALKQFYTEPIRCLLRLENSMDLWMQQIGPNGYFKFLEDTIGDTIKGDVLQIYVDCAQH